MKSAPTIIIMSIATLLGCTVNHKAMRSAIVMLLEKEAYICIGANDGIKLDDVLTVYRAEEVPLPGQAIVPDRSERYMLK